MRLVVLGMMGRSPFGGQTWLYANWLVGLARLGHEVWYVEDDVVWPYDPEKNEVTADCSYAVRHIASTLRNVGLPERWAFRFSGRGEDCFGLSSDRLKELYRSCDALLSIVGTTLNPDQLDAPYRVYVETDPVAPQINYANGDPKTLETFASYDILFTYGENFGASDCRVPLSGLTYHPTRQPIDLDSWPMVHTPDARYITTIGNYRQRNRDLKYQGEIYHWSKHHEWERFMNLPSLTSQEFEMALGCGPHDRRILEEHGWRLVPPLPMSLDVFGAYRKFFQTSRAEFTVAKDQNVRLRSGWFSERDACYLASGKPVIAQDTGYSNTLPTGEGLFSFSTVEDVLAAIDEISSNYARHCKSARAVAEEFFDARSVACRLLETAGLQ